MKTSTCISVVEDISEQVRYEAEIQKAKAKIERYSQRLERRNQDLNDFAYVASHDLRSPLRAIQNLSNWIREDCANILPDDSAKHFAELEHRSHPHGSATRGSAQLRPTRKF